MPSDEAMSTTRARNPFSSMSAWIRSEVIFRALTGCGGSGHVVLRVAAVLFHDVGNFHRATTSAFAFIGGFHEGVNFNRLIRRNRRDTRLPVRKNFHPTSRRNGV